MAAIHARASAHPNLILLLVALTWVQSLAGEEPPAAKESTLPAGAVARLGREDAAALHSAPALLDVFPDGKTLVEGESDGGIRLWDVATGQVQRSWKSATPFCELTHSADSKAVVAVACGNVMRIGAYPQFNTGAVVVWDAATGQEVRRFRVFESRLFYLVAFSADRSLVAVEGDGGKAGATVTVWEVATGKKLREMAVKERSSHLAFSPDAATVTAIAADGKTSRTFEVAGDKELERRAIAVPTLSEKTAFRADSSPVLSPDGVRIAVREKQALHLWELPGGKEPLELRKQAEQLAGIVFSRDGKLLAASVTKQTVTTIPIWDAATGRQLQQISSDHPVQTLRFSADGKLLMGALLLNNHRSSVRVWDVETGRELPGFGGHRRPIQSVTFSPDGKCLASLDESGSHLRVWDVAAAREILTLTGEDESLHFPVFSPDGKHLAAVGRNGVRIWDAVTGKERRLIKGANGGVACLSFNADGRLSAGCWDSSVVVWDAATGEQIHRLENVPIGGEQGGVLEGFDRKLRRLARGSAVPSSVVCFSPDGRTLGATCMEGGEWRSLPTNMPRESYQGGKRVIRLWDLSLRMVSQEIEAYKNPAGGFGWGGESVPTLIFSGNGRTVLAVYSHKVTGWETATGKERLSIALPTETAGEQIFAALSSDGALLATASAPRVYPPKDGPIHLWDTATGAKLATVPGCLNGPAVLAFAPDGRTLASGGVDGSILIWDLAQVVKKRKPAEALADKALESLWDDLAGTDAARAYLAVDKLAQLPEQAVPFLRKHVRPPVEIDLKRIPALVVGLDSGDFDVRQKANAELEKMGGLAAPALLKVLDDKPSLEVRRRVEKLLAAMERSQPVGEELRTLRALEVLERVATPEARQAVESLSRQGQETGLGREIQATLVRLSQRTAAP